MKKNNQLKSVTDTYIDNSNLSELTEKAKGKQPSVSVCLGHTKVEQAVYGLMFDETRKTMTQTGAFSIRYLMVQTGIYNYSSVRRAKIGLINKMSIERKRTSVPVKSNAVTYVIYDPLDIVERRRKAGCCLCPKHLTNGETESQTEQLIEQLVNQFDLSRRQAQVALKCAEGLSNAEIGAKLSIRPETVKFHLRNIFVKFGVKRRAELIAYLFRQESLGLSDKN